jgi:hypothetical protein
MKTVDPIYNGIDLKSGNAITSWIEYKTNVNTIILNAAYIMNNKYNNHHFILNSLLETHLDEDEH